MPNDGKPQIAFRNKIRWLVVLKGLLVGGIIILSLLVFLFFNISTTCPYPYNSKFKVDSHEIPMALNKYVIQFGNLPTEEQGLSALIEEPSVPPFPKDYKPIMQRKTRLFDPWLTVYILKYLHNGDYAIITLGRDKKVGGVGKDSDFNILNEEEYPKEFLKGY
jgi:type II secretion system protein G